MAPCAAIGRKPPSPTAPPPLKRGRGRYASTPKAGPQSPAPQRPAFLVFCGGALLPHTPCDTSYRLWVKWQNASLESTSMPMASKRLSNPPCIKMLPKISSVPKAIADVPSPDRDVGAPRSDDMDVVSTRQSARGARQGGRSRTQRPPGNKYR